MWREQLVQLSFTRCRHCLQIQLYLFASRHFHFVPFPFKVAQLQTVADRTLYTGRKISESLGNVTVRGEKDGKSKGECDGQQSEHVTENIYYSQLSSFAILLQPEPNCFTSYSTRKWFCFLSPYMLSSCGLPHPPTCLLLTVNEARSYFVSTICDIPWS
jgi:hypothetical protein